jgi:hypothetical protein
MHWRTARLCSSTSSCCISAPGEGKQEGREGGRKGERQEREREREREEERRERDHQTVDPVNCAKQPRRIWQP